MEISLPDLYLPCSYLALMRAGLWQADTATYNILIKYAGVGPEAESLLSQMRGFVRLLFRFNSIIANGG